MKQLYLSVALIVSILSLSFCSNAQGIYQFWGTTAYGGNNDQGVLFSARYNGTGIVPRQAFEIYTPGSESIKKSSPTPYKGKLYGMIRGAGPFNAGIIYEYDPAVNTYTTKAELNTISKTLGFYGIGTLVAYNDKLYGLVIEAEEVNEAGILIEFDPATGSLVKKFEFKNTTGAYPSTNLTLYNNKLYGCTLYGGAFNYGVVYSFDLIANSYSRLADLNYSTGIKAFGKLAVFNNRLYGTTREGGINNKGTLFEFNLASKVLSRKADFSKLGGVGQPTGLTLLNNKLYGGSNMGGAYNRGVIFEYNPAAQTLQKKIDLSPLNGSSVYGELAVYNNKLFGLTATGGSADEGVLFVYDPANNTYAKKVILSRLAMGATPYGSLVVLNNRMYGITDRGGANDKGVLFEYNPGINGYAKKIELGNNNGITPDGILTYYNGKLYGTTLLGGENKVGVIYSYDLATHTYAIRHHFQASTGQKYANGMVLHNNKFYGVCSMGGNINGGLLYEFDPSNDTYTVMHLFAENEKHPGGVPVVYNNKLYGTTVGTQGYDDGVLYEFDLAANSYTVKAHFGGSTGQRPEAGLTVYKNKLYGITSKGGAYDGGTLFEYNPAANVLVKRHDFKQATGYMPYSTMVVFKDILYGTTSKGGAVEDRGVVFTFDPASNLYTKKHDFLSTGADLPVGTFTVLNDKLYGMAQVIGYDGALVEYDPALNTFNIKSEFNGHNGRLPNSSRLTAVPAQVAPGTPGNCQRVLSVTINSSNYYQWVPLIDEKGNAVAEINANGNILGTVRASYYTHDGSARQDAAGRFCLSRNITITPSMQPVTPVSIRLYIRKAEFESLKNTPKSGVSTVNDLTVFQNNGSCIDAVTSAALPLTATATNWGPDHVYTAQTGSLATFYFAGKDNTPLPGENYRLQVKEDATPAPLQAAALNIQLNGNPVTGNNLVFQIYSPAELSLPVTVYDLTGKAIATTQLHLQKGIQTRSMTCAQIPAGVYHAAFHSAGKVHTVRFIRR